MKKKDLKKLADRNLKVECSLEEQILFEKYLSSFNDGDSTWDEKQLGSKEQKGAELFAKINMVIDNKSAKQTPFIFKQTNLVKIAASILLVISLAVAGLYLGGVFDKYEATFTLNEKITQPGQLSNITLYDGTKITLNANSKLRFPPDFNGSTRDVYLEGEAYFIVMNNTDKPFIIHSGKFTTVALGTEFNVKAFPEDDKFSVALVSGKVKVTASENNFPDRKITLIPSQQFTYDKITKKDNITEFDYFQVAGWKDNILIFKDQPLIEVIKSLYRAFGVEMEVVEASLYNVRITANFRNDSFWTVIKAMKAFTQLDYKVIDDGKGKLGKIIFYK